MDVIRGGYATASGRPGGRAPAGHAAYAIGTRNRIRTLPYNGYAAQVAGMYPKV